MALLTLKRDPFILLQNASKKFSPRDVEMKAQLLGYLQHFQLLLYVHVCLKATCLTKNFLIIKPKWLFDLVSVAVFAVTIV